MQPNNISVKLNFPLQFLVIFVTHINNPVNVKKAQILAGNTLVINFKQTGSWKSLKPPSAII